MPKQSRHTRRHTLQSNTYRFFVSADALSGREVVLEDSVAHQMIHVLRLQPGEHVLLLDNRGWQYVVELVELDHRRVVGTIERKEPAGAEPRTQLTLYIALLRQERFEWVLQKGTELGVSTFVPMICERGAIADSHDLSERKMERWNHILRESAEQSRRGKLPILAPALVFPLARDQSTKHGVAILLWEGGNVPALRQTLRGAAFTDQNNTLTAASNQPLSIAVLSGPEGGFAPSELELAQSRGIIPVTLGSRTLRAETAPLVAATAILYEMGDLDT